MYLCITSPMRCHKVEDTLATGIFEVFHLYFNSGSDVEAHLEKYWKLFGSYLWQLHDINRGCFSGFFCRYSERSLTKCVGITIETRPDYCLKRHLSDMLSYGCTRLEIGVQSVYEDVARDTNRWGGALRGKLSVVAFWNSSLFWQIGRSLDMFV